VLLLLTVLKRHVIFVILPIFPMMLPTISILMPNGVRFHLELEIRSR